MLCHGSFFVSQIPTWKITYAETPQLKASLNQLRPPSMYKKPLTGEGLCRYPIK